MSAEMRAETCRRVVPMPPQRGVLVDVWGVADSDDPGRTVTGPEGEPVIFYSFTDASRWVAGRG